MATQADASAAGNNNGAQTRNAVNASDSYAQVLSSKEVAWINSLPPGDATRTLPPATIARMKREGKWDTYVASTNSTNKSIATDLQEKERIEQRLVTGLEVAKTTGDVAQVGLMLTPAGKATGAIERVAGRQVVKSAESAAVRDIDAVGADGISIKGPYADMVKNPKNVGEGKDFTRAQKQRILEANRERNGGVLKSDKSGTALVESKQSKKGVKPPANEAQIDHIKPKSTGGTNESNNAQVLSREENALKSNKEY